MATNGNIVLDTPAQIEAAQVLALRAALRLETRGLKRRGRSALTIVREMGLTKARTSVKALEDVNLYISEHYGL
jgi:hypothetical protein